jgi:hypothetical protein
MNAAPGFQFVNHKDSSGWVATSSLSPIRSSAFFCCGIIRNLDTALARKRSGLVLANFFEIFWDVLANS